MGWTPQTSAKDAIRGTARWTFAEISGKHRET
jgi:hypothetical protein